jgi:hypothetical protein
MYGQIIFFLYLEYGEGIGTHPLGLKLVMIPIFKLDVE